MILTHGTRLEVGFETLLVVQDPARQHGDYLSAPRVFVGRRVAPAVSEQRVDRRARAPGGMRREQIGNRGGTERHTTVHESAGGI